MIPLTSATSMPTSTTIGSSVSPRRITGSCMGTPNGNSRWPATELREQNRQSHIKTPIDAKRLADFLAKIEAHETVLLQRQRDIENQAVVYRVEQHTPHAPQSVSPGMPNHGLASEEHVSRFAPIDLTTLQVYGEYR